MIVSGSFVGNGNIRTFEVVVPAQWGDEQVDRYVNRMRMRGERLFEWVFGRLIEPR